MIFYKINDKLYINVAQVSYFEIVEDTINPNRYMNIYLVRSSNGDRITLAKEEANAFLEFMNTTYVQKRSRQNGFKLSDGAPNFPDHRKNTTTNDF
jgi:hypothetical protein